MEKDWLDHGITILVVILIFTVQMLITTFLVLFERKFVAWMQVRIGPNRAGPWGLFQTVADALKLMVKEIFVPRGADRTIYMLAPFLTVFPAFMAFAILPIGPSFEFVHGDKTHVVAIQGANLNVGILWLLAMSSVAVYGVMLAGWASGSKYSLLGSVRASAQVISYEAALSLSILPVLLWTGTLDLQEIVAAQSGWNWYAFGLLLIPFVSFFISGMAETNRLPFDLVEAESELVAGFHTEYGGARFMFFFLAEYINIMTISAVAVTLFLGGWNGPWVPVQADPAGWQVALGVLYFFLKTFVLLFLFIWIRATLPRMRYDQLMSFGWKILIPVNLVFLMVLAGLVVMQEVGAWPAGFFR